MAQSIDFVIDRRVLLDIGIRLWHVGFRLIIVVVRHEVVHRVVWEQLAQLATKLGSQRLVVGDDECGALDLLDDAGNGERLAGSRRPQ